MTLKEDIEKAVADLSEKWKPVTQQVNSTAVPDSDSLVGKTAKTINATYLYTDMVDSSGLMAIAPAGTVASVMAAFIQAAVRVIRHYDGHIRSFDGDRVMGVFTGPNKETRATIAALKIRYAVRNVLDPAVRAKFGSVQKSDWHLREMTGVATGDALIVTVGIRNNADILSAGLAPNFAAKLSDVRTHGSTIGVAIGSGTYKALGPSASHSGGKNMWVGPYTIKLGSKEYKYYTSTYSWSV